MNDVHTYIHMRAEWEIKSCVHVVSLAWYMMLDDFAIFCNLFLLFFFLI